MDESISAYFLADYHGASLQSDVSQTAAISAADILKKLVEPGDLSVYPLLRIEASCCSRFSTSRYLRV